MQPWEKAVCDLFGEKIDISYIPKQKLARALAYLNADYEMIHFDLYEVAPNHRRFKNFTVEQKLDIERKLRERQALRDKAERERNEKAGKDSGPANREVCSDVNVSGKGRG